MVDSRESDDARIWRRLRAWFHLPAGHLLLEQESAQLEQVLGDLFGYHLLQVGCPGGVEMLAASRIRHNMVMSLEARPGRGGAALCGSAAALPFAGESLDVILLPHVLEFSPDPHQVLREVERTLIPEGHLIVIAFNPWSFWTLWRWLGWRRRNPPWSGRFHSPSRVQDWLGLLGFDTLQVRSFVYYPPVRHGALLRRLHLFEYLGRRCQPFLGAAYVLVARKRVATLTPLVPRWRLRDRLLPGGVPEPSARRNRSCSPDMDRR